MKRKSNEKLVGNPRGLFARKLLREMNESHSDLSLWGLSKINLNGKKDILDVGCGGGANIAYFLKKNPDCVVCGIDISKAALKETKRLNIEFYKADRLILKNIDVKDLSLFNKTFDLVTCFCTIRFWDDYEIRFKAIYEKLNKNGTLLICDHGHYDIKVVLLLLERIGFRKITTYKNDKNYNAILCLK